MYIIVESVKAKDRDKDKVKYIAPQDEEGFILSFVTEEQAIDYVEDLKEEQGDIDYQILEVA